MGRLLGGRDVIANYEGIPCTSSLHVHYTASKLNSQKQSLFLYLIQNMADNTGMITQPATFVNVRGIILTEQVVSEQKMSFVSVAL